MAKLCCEDLLFSSKEDLYDRGEVCAEDGLCENKVTSYLKDFEETLEGFYNEMWLRSERDRFIAWYPGY